VVVKKRLQPRVLQPAALRQILYEVAEHLSIAAPEYQISIRGSEIAYFYETPNVLLLKQGNTLYLKLPVPVSKRSDLYVLYEPIFLNVPVSSNNDTYTQISGVTDFIAVNVDMTHYLQLTQTELQLHCNGVHSLVCQKTFLRRKVESKTCIGSLIRQNATGILATCEILYRQIPDDQLVSIAYQITTRHYLLSNMPTHEQWVLTCGCMLTKPPHSVSRD